MKNWQKFQSVIKEADVRYAYKCEFESFLKGIDFTTPFGTDGFGRYEDLKILSEFKKDASLMVSRKFRMNVLAQAVMYIKEFIDRSPENLPNVVFCGDNFACFATDTDSLIPHLKDDIDWNRAPSSPDPKLIENLVNDENIIMFTYNISDWKGFDFKQIIDIVFKIKDKKTENKIEINEKNIVFVFEDWEISVLNDPKKKMDPHARVKNFIDSMIEPTACQHPKMMGRFITDATFFAVNDDGCKNFFNKYKQGYSSTTKKKFHSIQDRLVEDSKRRFQGEFFTPKVWVDEAHSMITEELGPNWYKDCLVIDCACGTANLTRDYPELKNLMLSTLNQEDIDVINKFGYNNGALVKKWDFLNENLPKEIEEKLIEAGKSGKRVVWFINPPFGTQNSHGAQSKSKIADTQIRKVMKEGYASPSQQLYCQFLFHILMIEEKYKLNSTIGFYSTRSMINGSQFSKFRDLFLSKKKFINGFLSPSKDFSLDTGTWGVLFSLWNNGKTTEKIIINVMDKNKGNIGKKELYWTNGNSASQWIKKKNIRKIQKIYTPNQTNGLDFCDMKTNGKKDSIFYMHNNANCVMHNGSYVGFYSVPFKSAHGDHIFPENFMESVSLYAARKLIKNKWMNNADEYLIPNKKHKDYELWNNDAVVYALFNTSNNCTAVREVQYKDKYYSIKNNFFWHTKEEMMKMADKHGFQEMDSDCKNDSTGESYLTTIIKNLSFSEKALKVLELADELLKDSMEHREEFHYSNDDKNLQAWDAGYYQLKFLWKEKHKILYAKFQKAYKDLEEQMKPMVHKLGFLKK